MGEPKTAHDIPDSTSSANRLPKAQHGERLTVRTFDYAFEGKAVARREDGYVIFVERALANELVEVEILKGKSKFADAKLIKVLEPSPERQTPICPYFGVCGGCAQQHMTYPSQLYWKTEQVRVLFERIGKLTDIEILPAIGAGEREYHYRNKMEFSFSEERWLTEEEIGSDSALDRFALGLHVRNRYDRVLDTTVCFLANQETVDVLNFTRRFTREHALGVYQPDTNPEGLMRFLVVRTSYATGEIMVNIVTSRFERAIMDRYAREMKAVIPNLHTVVNNVSAKRAQVAQGEFEETVFGPGTITDTIGSVTYRISANSFFQTNTLQAERLYRVAEEFAQLKPEDIVWDLYCGTGTISLFVASKVKQVLGIEVVEVAVADARKNAESNGITNVQFVASDLKRALTTPEFLAEHPRPTAMIIDPPRSGMHPDVVREVLALAPERIAYISCNPATQARDLDLMRDAYEIVKVQPVDMFPQTYHIESVAMLRRKSAISS